MDLSDNFGLRTRFPEIHALSHCGEIAFMASKPHPDHPENVVDEGSLITNRTDPLFFRKVFLQLYEENLFVKTTVEDFLTLNRFTLFDIEGSRLKEDWYKKNRVDLRETDPSKIIMLIPADWLAEITALQRFKERAERAERRKNRESSFQLTKSLERPKFQTRNPSIGTIRKQNLNVKIYSPLQEKVDEEQFYEVVPVKPTELSFNNPVGQGNVNFQESFG
jgi:hypothetical protein